MTDTGHQGRLIDDMVADLKPRRRLSSPWLRAAAWLAVVLAVAVVLASLVDMTPVRHRLMAVPDLWLAVLGSTATALLASAAVFQLGLPDRSAAWAFLPIPGLALWIGASGVGCARTWIVPGTHDASWLETGRCISFIIGLSVPLSLVTIAMLRRGFAFYPALTGSVAGLAVAAAAATLLNFFHPYDAALDDLLVHAAAVALVIGANRIFGDALLGRRPLVSQA